MLIAPRLRGASPAWQNFPRRRLIAYDAQRRVSTPWRRSILGPVLRDHRQRPLGLGNFIRIQGSHLQLRLAAMQGPQGQPLTEEQIEKEIRDFVELISETLARQGESSSKLAGVTGLSAVLQAYVSSNSTARIDRSLGSLGDALRETAAAIREVKESVSTIKTAADDFATSAAAGERSMRFWTAVLTLFTLAQVVIAVLEYLKPTP